MKSSIWALTKRVKSIEQRQRCEVPPEVIRAVSDWTIQQAEPQPRRGYALTREEWEALPTSEQVNAFVEGRMSYDR